MSFNVRKLTVCGVLAACIAAAVGSASATEPEQTARKIITRVQPVYPEIAKRAHLSGTVKFVVMVTPEGAVKTVRTVGGNAVLAQVAEEAVKRWKYEPLKNETTEAVTVNFEAQD
jgi:protein TonB